LKSDDDSDSDVIDVYEEVMSALADENSQSSGVKNEEDQGAHKAV